MEPTASTIFNGVITAETLAPVMDGVKELLPVVLPTVVAFLALRKGVSFVLSSIRGA